MILYENLYIGDSLIKKKNKIIGKIKRHKMMGDVYCITLPSNSANFLEVHYYNELLQSFYQPMPIITIGIGGSKYEAFDIVATLTNEVYGQTGGFDIKTYLNI